MDLIKCNELLRNHIVNYESYKAESCIINYYDKSNHMGGHLDDGEPD